MNSSKFFVVRTKKTMGTLMPESAADGPIDVIERDRTFKAQLVALIPQLRAFARTLGGNATVADDLAQEALLKAWSARTHFELGTNMKAWTFTILRNKFYSEKRRAWRNVNFDPQIAEQTLTAVDDPGGPMAVNELRQALAMLPPEQREALILVGAGGFAYEEAANICGVAVGTVKSRVSRARRALQDILDRGEYDRDGQAAGAAMGALFADVERLSNVR